MPFYLLLKVYIVVGGLHEAYSQVSREDDIHNVHLLNSHTVDSEFFSKLVEQLGGQFGLDISYSIDSDLFNKVSDSFITLLLEKLLEPIWSEIIKEFLDVFALSFFGNTNMEVHSDIKSDPYVVSGWHIGHWALVSNSVFGNHDADLLVVAIEHTAAWVHDAVVLSEVLLHGVHSVWNIDLAIATFLVFNDSHDWNSLMMCLRDFSWGVFRIVAIDQDQVGSCLEFTLNSIKKLVSWCLWCLIATLAAVLLAISLVVALVSTLEQLLLLVNHCKSICHLNNKISFIL